MSDRDTASLIIKSLGGSKNIRSIEKYGNQILIGVANKNQCNISDFIASDYIEDVIPNGSNIEVTVNPRHINSLAENLAEILNTMSMEDELESEDEEDDEPFPAFNDSSFQSLNNTNNPFPTINKSFSALEGLKNNSSFQSLNEPTEDNSNSFSTAADKTNRMTNIHSVKKESQSMPEEFQSMEEEPKLDKKTLREAAKQAKAEELARKQAEKEQAKADEIARKEAEKQAKIDEANRRKAEAEQAKADEIARRQAAKQAKIDEKARKKAERKAMRASHSVDINTIDNVSFGMYGDTEAAESNNILKTIANIFFPIIPAFIACGLMTTVYKIILIFYPGIATTDLGRITSTIAYSGFSILPVIVGYNTSKEFGGSPIIGAVLALVLTSSSINGITLSSLALVAGSGGIFSILVVSFLATRLELFLRRYIPSYYDRFLNPIITIVIMSFLGLLAVQPLGGLMAKYIAQFMRYIVYTYPKASGITSLLYLPVVMLGLQDGLYTVNMSIIQTFGTTYLLPIICMSGAGQVGACLYVFWKTQNPKLKNLCFTSLPLGILGIGEPLMWGITVPLGRPFIASCIGAAFGGTFISFMKVSTNYLELSGLPQAFFTNNVLYYLLGLLISYVMGFLCCMILKFKDPS